MTRSALLFGSIGVLAETSDIQRRAYNQAFKDAGLQWHWDEQTYRYLLQFVGGQARMRLIANAVSNPITDDDIADIHARKTALAGEMVKAEVKATRPGVREALAQAKQAGAQCAIVTSTQRANIEAIADAAGLDLSDFDAVITQEDVTNCKPDPEPYLTALRQLSIDPSEALAIEDTASSVRSAIDAGITTLAVPGAYATGQDFRLADHVVPCLIGENGTLVSVVQDAFSQSAAA